MPQEIVRLTAALEGGAAGSFTANASRVRVYKPLGNKALTRKSNVSRSFCSGSRRTGIERLILSADGICRTMRSRTSSTPGLSVLALIVLDGNCGIHNVPERSDIRIRGCARSR